MRDQFDDPLHHEQMFYHGDTSHSLGTVRGKEEEVFYLMIHSTHFIYGYMLSEEGRKEEGNVYLTTCSTHFIYGYMVSDIW